MSSRLPAMTRLTEIGGIGDRGPIDPKTLTLEIHHYKLWTKCARTLRDSIADDKIGYVVGEVAERNRDGAAHRSCQCQLPDAEVPCEDSHSRRCTLRRRITCTYT